MKIEIQNTDKIVKINDVPARVWQGRTESGVPVTVFVTRISPDTDKQEDHTQFQQELQQTAAPTARVQALPLYFFID